MAYTFQTPATAKYSVVYPGTTNREIVDGGSAASSITPAIAAEQINKLYAIVDIEFGQFGYGMKRTLTELAGEG